MKPPGLCAVFRSLDNRHFGGLLGGSGWRIEPGRLYHGTSRFSKSKGGSYAYVMHRHILGVTIPHAKTIILDHRLLAEEPALRIVLLHEMAHAKLMALGDRGQGYNAHGRSFVKELRRLLALGEECLRFEIDFYEGLK
jgi:hypothetical protein